jgi:hypothetical protein
LVSTLVQDGTGILLLAWVLCMKAPTAGTRAYSLNMAAVLDIFSGLTSY